MPSALSTFRHLSRDYLSLKRIVTGDAASEEVSRLIVQITKTSQEFLSACTKTPLVSRVPNKEYFSFSRRAGQHKLSRAVNAALYDPASVHIEAVLNGTIQDLPDISRSRLLYTVAVSYCCASDLLKTGDQKSPATFFECLNGHLLARAFQTNPRREVEVLQLEGEEEAGTLPTDFIFDLGRSKPKFHVPVKISTRERIIQVFAHQRVLDGVHGFGTFKGMLVCLTETKLDHTTREVVEICVPKQWNLYQRFIAPMHRFYYYDLPEKYAALALGDPSMNVVPFGKFFIEVRELKLGR
jgi:hypothetical protein